MYSLILNKNIYPIVESSPYPILISIHLFVVIVIINCLFSNYIIPNILLLLYIISFISTIYGWIYSIQVEASILGRQTHRVSSMIYSSLVVFILTEAIIFTTVIMSYLYNSFIVSIFMYAFPPINIERPSAMDIALFNTAILLISSITFTLSHYSLMIRSYRSLIFYMMMTLILAFLFTALQSYEFYYLSFGINDSLYGGLFFFISGLHAVHIIVGSLSISILIAGLISYRFTSSSSLLFNAILLYWHFLDLVWLVIYILLYL